MEFFTKKQLLNEAEKFESGVVSIESFATDGLFESVKDSEIRQFDLFISHSAEDKKYVLGLYNYLTKLGKSVYVDWIVDTELNRTEVDENTALVLRNRMANSTKMIFAFSMNAAQSKWMPWELGFFDGVNGKENVKILPIMDDEDEIFEGVEFAMIYDVTSKDDLR